MRFTHSAPLLGLALALGGGVFCAMPARADDKPASPGAKTAKAEEIIAKSIEAVGGEAALNKLKNRIAKGTLAVEGQEIKGPMEVYERAPNFRYVKVEITSMGAQESGCDGKVLWEKTIMGPRILEGEERAMAQRESRFNAVLFWRDFFSDVEFAGEEDVNGQACYRLNYTTKTGTKESTWHDKKTYLPVKVTMTVKGPTGEIPLEIFPEDYRKVDGVLIPFKTIQAIGGGMQRIVLTLESVEHNVDIPDARFKLPPEIQELVDQAASRPAQP